MISESIVNRVQLNTWLTLPKPNWFHFLFLVKSKCHGRFGKRKFCPRKNSFRLLNVNMCAWRAQNSLALIGKKIKHPIKCYSWKRIKFGTGRQKYFLEYFLTLESLCFQTLLLSMLWIYARQVGCWWWWYGGGGRKFWFRNDHNGTLSYALQTRKCISSFIFIASAVNLVRIIHCTKNANLLNRYYNFLFVGST